MATKRVLVVSDTQVGSIFGLLLPGFETSDDKPVIPNAGQTYLWECWLDMCRTVRRMEIAAVVVNGDVIDGHQAAQRGTELSLPMLRDQERAAVEVLSPLKASVGDAAWYFVQGTEYHSGKAGHHEEVIAEQMGAVHYKGLGTGRHSREVLDLDVDGVILNFSHGISVPTGFYRATPLDREGIWSALVGKEGKLPKADVVVRSHAHFFCRVEHPSKHILITPCWQLQTRYMRRHSVYRMVPDLGYLVLGIDGEAKKNGEDPLTLWKKIYPLPAYKPTKLSNAAS